MHAVMLQQSARSLTIGREKPNARDKTSFHLERFTKWIALLKKKQKQKQKKNQENFFLNLSHS